MIWTPQLLHDVFWTPEGPEAMSLIASGSEACGKRRMKI